MQTREVLVYTLSNTLKLAHPYMPFITEELWQAMPGDSEALIAASWPQIQLKKDKEALEYFSAFQDTIRAVRNARAEYGVEAGKKISASVVTNSPDLCQYFNEEIQAFALLARLDKEGVSVVEGAVEKESKTDSKQIELVVKEGLEVILPLAGLFDPAKEIERLQKQAEKISKELEGLNKRLSNKNFVDKAPENVVSEVQMAAKECSEQLAVVEEKIKSFQNM